MKAALGEFDEEVVLCKKVENVMHGINMIGDRRTSANDDVIHVDVDHHPMQGMSVDEGMENVVHHSLKGCRRVGEAEVHNHGFPNTKTGLERHFPLVSVADMDVVIPPPDVKGGKDE